MAARARCKHELEVKGVPPEEETDDHSQFFPFSTLVTSMTRLPSCTSAGRQLQSAYTSDAARLHHRGQSGLPVQS